MTSSPKSVENYSVSSVPESKTISGWRVALVVIGINVGLSTFLNGAQVGSAIGLSQALLCAFYAGLILCAFGIFTSIASVRSRLTTYLLVQHSFGVKGAVIVNIALAVIHLGWFGVNASFFGSAMAASIAELYEVRGPFALMVMGGSILMALTTAYGFRAIDRLAMLTIPVLLLIFFIVFVLSIREFGLVTRDPTPHIPMTFGVALSALVGGNLLTVAAMPDLSRFIRNNRQAVIGMLFSFPIAIPVLVCLAVVPTMATDDIDIMNIIVGFGLGVPALLVLLFSTWTANSVNLYSSSLSLSATFGSVAPWKFTAIGALVGGGMAVAGIIDSFVPFLLLLGVILPPVAVIYVIDCFTLFRNGYDPENLTKGPAVRWSSMVTWVVAASISLAGVLGIATLTGSPALDATLAAVAVHLPVRKWLPGVWAAVRLRAENTTLS